MSFLPTGSLPSASIRFSFLRGVSLSAGSIGGSKNSGYVSRPAEGLHFREVFSEARHWAHARAIGRPRRPPCATEFLDRMDTRPWLVQQLLRRPEASASSQSGHRLPPVRAGFFSPAYIQDSNSWDSRHKYTSVSVLVRLGHRPSIQRTIDAANSNEQIGCRKQHFGI